MGVTLHDVAEGRAILARVGWLSRTSPEFCVALLDRAQWRLASAGDTIVHSGSMGGPCGVARGTVEISSSDGPPDSSLVHLAHGGFWAGNRPLLTGKPRRLSIVALDEVLWANVPIAASESLLKARPEWWRFMGQLAEEGGEIATAALADMTLPDTQRRAVAVLLRLAGCRYKDPDGPASLAVTQQHLADFANMSRQTASTILRNLAARNMVELRYHQIVVLEPATLRAMVDGV